MLFVYTDIFLKDTNIGKLNMTEIYKVAAFVAKVKFVLFVTFS